MLKRVSRHGFTLVELSIVLVILGLLVGGVLSGQSLIRASELRSVVTERDKYVVTIHAFKDKYFALPGDMKNAFAFWGTDCGTDTTDASVGCNGDGNGKIDNYSALSEGVKTWEHLSRAGLIEGQFDGTGTVSGGVVKLSATNVPKAKFSSAVWNIGIITCENCGAGTPSMDGHVQLTLGTLDDGADPGWVMPLVAMTNAEAWNIDTKTDDGFSQRGIARGANAVGNCSDYSADDPYTLSSQADVTGQCVLTFILQ